MSAPTTSPSASGFKGKTLATVLTVLAVAVVLVGGWGLGRVMLSPGWTKAVSAISMTSLLLVMWFRPSFGLLLWVFLLPYADFTYIKIDLGSSLPDLDISRMGMLVLSLRLLLRAIGAGGERSNSAVRRPQRITAPEIAMACFALGMALSFRPSSGGLRELLGFVAVPLLMYFVAPGVVFYLSRTLLRSRSALMATVWMVAATGLVLGAIAIREQLTGLAVLSPVGFSIAYEGNLRKVLSLFGAPSLMMTALSVPVPLLIYGLRQLKTSGHRVLLGLALVVALAGNFFVFVRAGWLGAVVSILILVLFSANIRRVVLRVLPVVVLVGALVVVLVVTPEVVGSRLSSSAPIDYRVTAWEIAWDLFVRSPITGSGFGTFGAAATAEFGWNPHTKLGYMPTPHNSYLYVLASGGLLAFIPYLAIFLALAWRGVVFWRTAGNRDLVATLWATMACYMLINGTIDALSAHYTNVLFFMILGALIGRLEESQSEVPA